MTKEAITITAPDVPKGYGVKHKGRRWPALVVGILLTTAMLLFMLLQSLLWVTFDESRYLPLYRQNNVEMGTGMSEATLMKVTREMLRYLDGSRDELQMKAVIRGEERNVYTEREVQHMVDVKTLFDLAKNVRDIAMWCVIALLVLAVAAAHAGYLRIVGKGMLWGLAGFGALVVIAAAIGMIDFTWFFTQFHNLFFANDLWLLDPARSLLINMLPQPFFVSIAGQIMVIVGISLAVIAYLAYVAFMAPRRGKSV